MHNRYNRDSGFSRFSRLGDRRFQSPLNGSLMQPHITSDFAQNQNGGAVIAALNVVPRTFGGVGGLQPSLALPFGLEFAGVVAGRQAKLGGA